MAQNNMHDTGPQAVTLGQVLAEVREARADIKDIRADIKAQEQRQHHADLHCANMSGALSGRLEGVESRVAQDHSAQGRISTELGAVSQEVHGWRTGWRALAAAGAVVITLLGILGWRVVTTPTQPVQVQLVMPDQPKAASTPVTAPGPVR